MKAELGEGLIEGLIEAEGLETPLEGDAELEGLTDAEGLSDKEALLLGDTERLALLDGL